jgi:hypothetical protein
MYDYTDNVRRGIALLDAKAPAGWRDRIDWPTVNIYDIRRCVASQAIPPQKEEGYYGSIEVSGYTLAYEWIETLNHENDTDYNCEDFGFNTHTDDDWDEEESFYSPEENLIGVWKRELGVSS